MVEEVDRKALLKGDIEIWLKEKQSYLNDNLETCTVSNLVASKIAIIEKGGKCYVSMPFIGGHLDGMLYETRDSFEELVAQYQGKEIAGSNASETEE